MRTLAFGFVVALGPASALSGELHVPADYASIQRAITAASDGDEILVLPGTYHETIDLLGKGVTVRGIAGAASTILDGTGLGTVVRCVTNETTNTRLVGLTIMNAALAIDEYGVLCIGSSPFFEQCAIRDTVLTTNECSTFQQGVAVRVVGGSPFFVSCAIEDNGAVLGCATPLVLGVALHVSMAANVFLQACSIARNTIAQQGPSSHAIVVGNSSITFDHCMIEDNDPGAVFAIDSQLTLESSTVRDHARRPAISSTGSAPGIARVDLRRSEIVRNAEGGLGLGTAASATVVRSTLADNGTSSPQFGYDLGMAHFLWTGALFVEDSIVFGQGMKFPSAQGTITVRYSDVSGAWPGVGNIALDPKFIAPAAFDYRIGTGSPCIDAGDPNGAPDPGGTLPDQGAHPFEPWQRIEAGIGGYLNGFGTLHPNTQYTIVLHTAQPSPFVMIVGTSAQSIPVPYGTLVPVPTFVLSGFTTPGQGLANETFDARWPPGAPTGKSLVMQAFVRTPVGWTPTDALIATEP